MTKSKLDTKIKGHKVGDDIPVYYDQQYEIETGLGDHLINGIYRDFRVFPMGRLYKVNGKNAVVFVTNCRSITLHQIQWLEYYGWEIIGVSTTHEDVKKGKEDQGYNNATIRVMIRKKEQGEK
jgi:hypothetical protein